MDGLFGGRNNKISTSAPIVAGFRVQTSAYGRPVPRIFGMTRVAANLLWYGDFTAIAHTTSTATPGGSGGKGGGGAPTQENTTYTYTAAVLLLLCRGPIGAVPRVWRDKEITTLAALGLSLYTGSTAQTAFPHLATNHPSEALAYRLRAYLASAALDLGESAQLMNYNLEVEGEAPFSGAIKDANPKDVILALAAEAGIAARIGDLTQYSDYCVANGIFVSPAYVEQRSAAELLAELARIGNAEIVPSEDKIKLIPYSDEAKTGNGVTYTPQATPIFEFTDADFLHTSGEAPVSFEEEDTSDAFNVVKVRFYNRAKDYAEDVVEAQDDDNIALYGRRPMEEPIQLYPIVDASVAMLVATNELARQLYFRTSYRFKLGPGKADLLEPMDVVSITRASLGISALPVRVREIEELQDKQQDGFSLLVREFPAGAGAGVLYPVEGGSGYGVDYNADPGNVNTPVILDAPAVMADSGFELWLAVSGASANWGGCQVWVATDVGGPFKQVGSIFGPARHGALSATLATGADPDTVNTCAVDLSVSKGSLTGGTQADADNLSTLSWIEGELVSFQSATLTAQYKYDLATYLRRGVFNTPITAHAVSARFVRLDQAVFRYPYAPDLVGKTLYVKLPSFNIFGAAARDLSAVSAYSHTIQGPIGAPQDVADFTAAVKPYEITLAWGGDPAVDLNVYELWEGAAFGSGTRIFLGKTHSHPVLPRAAGTYDFHAKALDQGGKYSINAVSASVTIDAIGAPVVDAIIEGTDAIFSLALPPTQFAIDHTEARYGASFAAGTPLGTFKGSTFKTPISWAGARTFHFAVTDAGAQTGAAGSLAVTITAPAAPAVTASIEGPNYKLKWTVPAATLPLNEYEVRQGASYAAGTFVARLKGTDLQRLVDWGGNRDLWVAGYDANGNEGMPGGASINISAPGAGVLTHQVLDNNILLYWTESPGTLPIATHEIAKGDTYAGAALIGTKSGQFTSLFETQAGIYTYWDTPIDTAGNRGAQSSISATMSQPPDYVLQADDDSDFSGTKDHAVLDSTGALVLPVTTTETWTQHFTNNAWSTPQAQITAGYPVFIEPSAASGYYEEVIDYGTALAASKITVTPTYQILDGTPGVAVQISTSLDDITYSTPVVQSELFATNFRYAKIRVTVTSSGGDDLVNLSALNVRLDVKLKTESAIIACVSTDTDGTEYVFQTAFLDVASFDATPIGTTNLTAVVNFTDAANPTSGKILLFNAATGARVSGDASLTVKGY